MNRSHVTYYKSVLLIDKQDKQYVKKHASEVMDVAYVKLKAEPRMCHIYSSRYNTYQRTIDY